MLPKMITGQPILMAILWNWFLGWFSWNAFAQVQPDCDFTYSMNIGSQQILQSPGFDQGMYYGPGKVCRWQYSSAGGTVFDVSCNPIDLPSTANCQQDRLVISKTGHPTLADGQNYCGYGTAHVTSSTNALSIGLISAVYSNGGRYRCVITVIGGGNPPPTTSTTTTTTARPSNCDCGWRQQTRIVGGDEATPNEFAFMAALIDIQKTTVWCGASIISNRYALTAAHCVVQQSITQYGLLVGDHNIKLANDTSSAALYKLQDYIVHDYYNSQTMENDIAIVKTSVTIAFSLKVGPVCLPYRYPNVDFTNAPVTTMGWGTLFFSGPKSDTLQKVNLTIVSKTQCQSGYPQDKIFDSQVCTYASRKDTCSYDSGGPVVWFDTFNTQRYQIIGLVSYGSGCATSVPGVNTRVPSFVSWILNQTPDAFYCLP